MRTRSHRRLAQTVTEYMLIISVIVIALTAAVYNPMNQALKEGSDGFRDKYQAAGKNGYVGNATDGRR